MSDTDSDDDFKLEFEPSEVSRSLIALDPAVTTPRCESAINNLTTRAQSAVASDIRSIRGMFEQKRDELRRSYESSLKLIDQSEVDAVESYFISMFERNQSWISRTRTMMRWMLGMRPVVRTLGSS